MFFPSSFMETFTNFFCYTNFRLDFLYWKVVHWHKHRSPSITLLRLTSYLWERYPVENIRTIRITHPKTLLLTSQTEYQCSFKAPRSKSVPVQRHFWRLQSLYKYISKHVHTQRWRHTYTLPLKVKYLKRWDSDSTQLTYRRDKMSKGIGESNMRTQTQRSHLERV